MTNEIGSLGTFGSATFRPEALQAYQQYLQQTQQQNAQQTDKLTQQSNVSLINPYNTAQAQNYSNGFANNNYYQAPQFASKYSNDIFTQQLYNSKPWEQYGAVQPNGQKFGGYNQLNTSLYGGGFSNDIFAQQLYKTKPWEQISNQTTAQANAGYNFPQYQQNGYVA